MSLSEHDARLMLFTLTITITETRHYCYIHVVVVVAVGVVDRAAGSPALVAVDQLRQVRRLARLPDERVLQQLASRRTLQRSFIYSNK